MSPFLFLSNSVFRRCCHLTPNHVLSFWPFTERFTIKLQSFSRNLIFSASFWHRGIKNNLLLPHLDWWKQLMENTENQNKTEQAGNGPSRRHIQGSKIAKGLQSIKYSLLKYLHEEKIEKKLFFNFFRSGKSHSAEKCKRGPQKNLINLYLKCQ